MTHQLAIFSDTHGQAPPTLGATIGKAILHAGDTYDAAADPEGADTDALQNWLQRLRVPTFAVRGNHDHNDPLRFFRRCEDVSGRLLQVLPGLFVAGIGLAPTLYYDLPGEMDLLPQCDDMLQQALRLDRSRDHLVLLTHYPPRVARFPDEALEKPGWTFDCIRELIQELRPLVVVAGHVHERFGQTHWVEVARRQVPLIIAGPRGGILTIDMSGRSVTFQSVA